MRIQRLIFFLLAVFLFFSTPIYASVVKQRALSDLECIKGMFSVKYAPLKWKGEFANWDLDQAIEAAKDKIESMENPSLKECQIAIRDFFNSTKDYHVGINFYSTETACLPFMIKGAGKRYFVCDIDEYENFSFEVGDEILTFDQRPIHEVIDELRISEYGANTYETDHALAQMTLTNRRGVKGHVIPNGSVVITAKKQSSGKEVTETLKWSYTPEKIRDSSQLGLFSCQPSVKKRQFFDKWMVFNGWDQSYVGLSNTPCQHDLGSRFSYVPPLGKQLWKSSSDWFFNAYIFKTDSGKRVGYIRIPHYTADEEEVEEFGLIMNYFQKKTDALVIDQLNNPGGSAFYLYALASMLTDKPMQAPKHHIAMTQEEVHTAFYLLKHLEHIRDNEDAKSALGDDIGGYPVDMEFVRLMKQFCHFLVEQWNSGELYTKPTHLFGVDKINPHPTCQYTKPILVLINSLNFSGGDFFPAILQDNKRATLMGTRTAGAGGYVASVSFPNLSGIRSFNLTGSLAERIDQNPIENLGVKPDISYELTAEDLQTNFEPYKQAVLKAIEDLK